MRNVSVIIDSNARGYKDEQLVYKRVEEALYCMGLDTDNYGTPSWSPFKSIIKEGQYVVIKPNLVLHVNGKSTDIDAVVCHAAMMRPVVDYALKALNGTGKLVIADAPMGNANFEEVIERNGVKDLVEEYKSKGIELEVRDLRGYYYPTGFYKSVRTKKDGDPEGLSEIVLGKESYLSELNHLERLYGADFNREQIVSNHKDGMHKYMVSNTVLHADVIISMPKLKTHQKTGITVNLKNLVGINGNKNYLAHYRIGSPREGGDEYPDTSNLLLLAYRWLWKISKDVFLQKNNMFGRYMYFYLIRIIMAVLRKTYVFFTGKHVVERGGWYGNDTCWRMCLDLNYILRYANKEGKITTTPQREYICIVDGIVAGDEDGPLCPTPNVAGVIMASNNPYYADYVSSHIMGFDPMKVPYIKNCQIGGRLQDLDFNKMDVICLKDDNVVDFREVNLHFKPQAGWEGHIEKEQ